MDIARCEVVLAVHLCVQALKTLSQADFLSKEGPGRDDMHAMFEVLCKNRSGEPSEAEIDMSYKAVRTLVGEAAKPGVATKLKRAAWQASVAQMMTKGMCRRAHFKVVISADVLRHLGFTAQELHELRYSPKELRLGGFTARELKGIGLEANILQRLGYSPKDLCDAQVPVETMKALHYTAKQLHSGGYTAQQMKDSRSYSLVELREGLYKAAELAETGYTIDAMRQAKFTALELRRALVFSVSAIATTQHR